MGHIDWKCIKVVPPVEREREVSIFLHDEIGFLIRSGFYSR